jgi:hypothetical protein
MSVIGRFVGSSGENIVVDTDRIVESHPKISGGQVTLTSHIAGVRIQKDGIIHKRWFVSSYLVNGRPSPCVYFNDEATANSFLAAMQEAMGM